MDSASETAAAKGGMGSGSRLVDGVAEASFVGSVSTESAPPGNNSSPAANAVRPETKGMRAGITAQSGGFNLFS